jgi:hypothetical protein
MDLHARGNPESIIRTVVHHHVHQKAQNARPTAARAQWGRLGPKLVHALPAYPEAATIAPGCAGNKAPPGPADCASCGDVAHVGQAVEDRHLRRTGTTCKK